VSAPGTPLWTTAHRVLVLAKAPVVGRVKTRLGATVGMAAAADLAAAALLDTVEAANAAVGPGRCLLALEGDLRGGQRAGDLAAALGGWRSYPQRGDGLGERIAAAHADAGAGPVVQIGMDTPQVGAADLDDLAARLEHAPAVLAPAADGGWWALALRDPARALAVEGVPMSTATTHDDTRRALEAAGTRVAGAPVLADVDTAEEAAAVAQAWPDLRFSRAWRALAQ
jgi:hypothetical protein